MEREAFVVASSPSRCSSGCQSGWTLYLDHSDDGMRYIPLEPARRWMVQEEEEDDDGEEDDDDSMVSDASSGPTPPRLAGDEEGEELRRDFREPPHQFFGRHRCHSSSGSASASGSGSYGARSPSLLGHQPRRAVAVHGEEIGDDDDLDDTASSSAAFGCPVAMVYIAPAESPSSTSHAMLEQTMHAQQSM